MFLITLRFRFNQSQTLENLTKYVWKNINIQNTKIITIRIIVHFGIIDVDIFYYIFNHTLESFLLLNR